MDVYGSAKYHRNSMAGDDGIQKLVVKHVVNGESCVFWYSF